MAVTLVSVLMSWLVTWVAMLIFGLADQMMYGMPIATICPMLIAPGVTYVILRLLVKLHQTEKIARQLARFDPLTGVLNRAFFFRPVRSDLENYSSKDNCALFVVDLDFFKAVNDKPGHIEGDRVLVTICNSIKLHPQTGEWLGRFGGDEFVIWMVGGNFPELKERADKICTACIDEMRQRYANAVIKISVSIGGASSESGNNSLERLLHVADQ